jgi:hypothetical protein
MKLMVWRRTATLLWLSCSLISCSLIFPQAGRAQAMGDQATGGVHANGSPAHKYGSDN